MTPKNDKHFLTSVADKEMATASYPSRQFGSNHGKGPERSLATFGASSSQQQRESQRERERLEKERMEREEQNQLTEEQKEEIKEAVGLHLLCGTTWWL